MFDDRINASAGEKFADADLIGCPFRIVVSAKTGDKIEMKERNGDSVQLVTFEDLLAFLNA